MALPSCPACQATLRPFGPLGYDGPIAHACASQASEACPVDICSACAAFCEPDADIDHEGYYVDRTVARCGPCEAARKLEAT